MTGAFLEAALAGLRLEPDVRDAIIGDLIEARAEEASRHGEAWARWWMVSQIARTLPALARASLREGGAAAVAGAAGAACGTMVMMLLASSATAAVAFRAIPPGTLARFAVLVLAIDLGYAMAGGYLAARLGRVAPLASALTFGGLGMLLSIVSPGSDLPGWYPIALQLLLLPATAVGGWIRSSQLLRTS